MGEEGGRASQAGEQCARSYCRREKSKFEGLKKGEGGGSGELGACGEK